MTQTAFISVDGNTVTVRKDIYDDLLAALKALGEFIEALPATGDTVRLVCLKDAAIAKASGI